MTREQVFETTPEEPNLKKQLPTQQQDTNNTNNEDHQGENEEIPSVVAQRKTIKEIIDNTKLQEGEKWYLIDVTWFNNWKNYVGYNNEEDQYSENSCDSHTVENTVEQHPGPIDNSSLVNSSYGNPKLTFGKQEKIDFEILPEQAWNCLYSWYGGGPIIDREVIAVGMEDNIEYRIELFPFFIHLAFYEKKKQLVFEEFRFPSIATLKDIKLAAQEYWNIPQEKEIRIWKCFQQAPYRKYSDDDEDQPIEILLENNRKNQMVIESQDENGDWKIADTKFSSGYGGSSLFGSSNIFGERSTYSKPRAEPGICGLRNLGNTCFMNTSVQCLSKTPFFKDFFITGEYKKDINLDNPLGHKGKIAESFAELIQEMWSGYHSELNPIQFKRTIGSFEPRFSGYGQQDSQELLAYLLDGLSEDLNRIKKKPLTDPVESEGNQPDEEVARKAWDTHKLRNDSIIVDRFQGQLKSTLVCPKENCKTSITFDPFMYLSLPLPSEKTINLNVTLFPAENGSPILYALKLNKNGFASEIRHKVSELSGIPSSDLVIADVYQQNIYRFIDDEYELGHVSPADTIFAYHVPGLPEDVHESYGAGPLTSISSTSPKQLPFAKANVSVISSSGKSIYSSFQHYKFGEPFVLSMDTDNITGKELYDKCFAFLSRFMQSDVEENLGISFDNPEELFISPPAPSKNSAQLNDQDPDSNMKDNNDDDDEEQVENTSDEQDLEEEELLNKRPFFRIHIERRFQDPETVFYNDEPLINYVKSMSKAFSVDIVFEEEILNRTFDNEKLRHVEEHNSVQEEREEAEKDVDLQECLELFTSEEQLGASDAWYCNKCKEFVQATKKMDLFSLPEILVIFLKRFQYSTFSRDKIETFVDFPVNGLDLSSFVPKSHPHKPIYNLYGVSNHFGGLGGGHYTAFARYPTWKQWYKFEDSHTAPVSEDSIRTSAAYVLFYVRQDVEQRLANDSEEQQP
eukprot:gb/GECH01014123.1/.p1 GENE.gb/GECH01014123.1/~~gb/GECH01014123.1/.p1  ORF type:complete len:968 (+),score=294.85 gb/GECH01014123.1/:1-2904(+)